MYVFLAVLGLHGHTGFSLVLESRGYSLVGVCRISLQWPPLLRSTGFKAQGFQMLWLMGSAAETPGS